MRWLFIWCLAAAACACRTAPSRGEEGRLAPAVLQSPERYIVAAVDDTASPAPPPAGGTPRGYDGNGGYGPTWHARAAMRSLASTYGLNEVAAWPIHPLRLHCAVFKIPEGTDRATVLALLVRDSRVKLAQPLQGFVTRSEAQRGYIDPYVGLQTGFAAMQVADAQESSQGEGVRVAIIDTGVDTLHPDLKTSIAATANFIDDDAGRFRRDRHGTEIAGVIAAVANNHEGIVGVAPRARLYVYKACWQAHEGADEASRNSFTLAQALVAALDANAQVINMSLAGPADPLLHDLIQEALRRGVLLVGAAPLSADESGSLLHETGALEVASVGNTAAPVSSLHAPGREILTLLPGGHYDFASGDSIATAEVSGVVALLLAKSPGLSAATVYRLLRDTSAGGPALADADKAVNACAAMASLVVNLACSANRTDQPPLPVPSTADVRVHAAASAPQSIHQ